MRRRQALKVVKEFDAFPKVSEDYIKPTTRGGLFSIVSITIILFLIVSELSYFKDSEIVYEYMVDTDMTSTLKLRFDITVAMPCDFIGADVVDAAGSSKSLQQEVHKEPTIFELNEEQKAWLAAKQEVIRQHEGLRLLRDVMFDSHPQRYIPFPEHPQDSAPLTSCRVHGHIQVNKVSGNFHITAGQAVPHPQGHAHLSAFVPTNMINFSHRIDSFGFGVSTPGMVDPLEGTYIIAHESNRLFQYYIQIVPTTLQMRGGGDMHTNQYSVTERNRAISHKAGSHGLPGLFFKYEIYSLMVLMKEVDRPLSLFLVRLCAVVGGVFATLGMISQFLGYVLGFFKRTKSEET